MNKKYQLFSTMFSRQKGVGIIEVLICLTVIMIGLIGMLNLLTRGLYYNQKEDRKFIYTVLANDMLERIQQNARLAKQTTLYKVSSDDYLPKECSQSYYPISCENNRCNQEQMAIYEIKYWKFQIFCISETARGSIELINKNGGKLYQVTIDYEVENATTEKVKFEVLLNE